jgi:hypothetical protein
MAWCAEGDYPGFNSLPDGLVEVHRIQGLVRTDVDWAPAPDLSDIQLPGQITIASFTTGDPVSDVAAFEGTFTDTDSDIWVLVFTTHGRWYPQSENPCAGPHIRAEEGRWQAPQVYFGEVGLPYDVVVITATDQASAVLSDNMRLWCEAGYYPGLHTIELPEGIDEKAHVRVIRE